MPVAREPEAPSSPARTVDPPRVCAGILAILGWTALGIELNLTISGALSAQRRPASAGARPLFQLFHHRDQSPLALVLTTSCLRPDAESFFLRPGVRTGGVVYIIMVGSVYAILLSSLYHWTGLCLSPTASCTSPCPILYPLYWLVFIEKGRIKCNRSADLADFPDPLLHLYPVARRRLRTSIPIRSSTSPSSAMIRSSSTRSG